MSGLDWPPPGWYELRSRTPKCQKCPPGSYCPGGRQLASRESVRYDCPQGRTSPSGSVSIEACDCRRGYFWDQTNACSPCPASHFKNHTGDGVCQSCPENTISKQGSIEWQECYCPEGEIDMDFSDAFNCIHVSELGDVAGNSSLARTQIMMYIFNGSLTLFSGSLEMVRLDLLSYLTLSPRASLQTDLTGTNQVDFKVTTSELEEAATLQAKMDPVVFVAFVFANGTLATLTSDTRVTRSLVAEEMLRCPDGLGFASGALVRNQSDCKCTYGYEPIGTSGLGSGCRKCPRGKHKSVVGDTSCSSCGGLTTLLEGSISSSACTCSAGFVNEILDEPTDCNLCGKGFYCTGGRHKQACGQSFTTLSETAKDSTECVCASGFYRVAFSCEPCPMGTFKQDIGDGACQPCPAGTWSNELAAAQESACNFCSPGSTTRDSGAQNLSFCVRPELHQLVLCTSGVICSVDIMGFQLQDGHHLALTKSSCDAGKVAVSGVASQGISKPATHRGSRYVWGNSRSEFSPEGGLYNLCWCANMRSLTCGSLRTNFILSAGQLEVIGPVANHSFECVRGQDCSGLTAFQGHLLSSENEVALRNECGGSEMLSVAAANPEGTGSLSISSGVFSLAFGEMLLDANQAGYSICWCGQGCVAASDFAVPAGRLRVLGPYASQQANCFLGQQCRLQQIQGVGLLMGDKIMLRTNCDAGPMLPGSPGDGISSYNETRKEYDQRAQSMQAISNNHIESYIYIYNHKKYIYIYTCVFFVAACVPHTRTHTHTPEGLI